MIKRALLGLALGVAAVPLVLGPADAAGPGLSIDDVIVVEPSWPDTHTPAVFTVTLDQPVATTVTVDYAASAPAIEATSGTLTFAPGDVSEQLTVQAVRRPTVTSDETFLVTLSNSAGAPIADAWGIGTVRNSDRKGSWGCHAEPVDVWNYVWVSVGGKYGYEIDQDVPVGSERGCPNTDTSDPMTTTNRIPGPLGAGGYTVEVGATRAHASTVPWPNPADTRPFVGDGADNEASVASVRITGPGLDLRIDAAQASVAARCAAIGSSPAFTSASRVSGMVLNGQPIGTVTDPMEIPIAGGTLWLNRTKTSYWPLRIQNAVELVLNSPFNHVVYLASASVYTVSGNPCST